ncbi:general substrate transporter [Coniochaeta ligniaria NRRL 30616]|uniref:General substrate transporter n=1 Tax=Coniochaeta ligniaria NRRL 30616 TaxID=1408157 RepID=A0A1J7IAT3_9PEZI|nr:general substrate transporter [Coniochaeta ligniaria NRRL 30616]
MESEKPITGAQENITDAKALTMTHSEHAVDNDYCKESSLSKDMTPREQYKQLWANLKKDRRFVLWSCYVMILVFGWGYDAGLSGAAIAFPEFRKVYGNYYAVDDSYVIPALWQSLWNAASTIGQVFGAFLTGQFADWAGRRALLWTAIVLSLSSSFALVFAPNLPVLFVSKLLLGFAIGFSTATPPLYVTENSPAALRSTLSSLTNVVIVLGFFVSSLSAYGSSKISGEWSYRLAFTLTFLIPGLFAIVLPFLPESPVWYIKKGREEDARKAIIRLFGNDTDVEARLAYIKSELEVVAGEASLASQTNWKAIFSKEHRARTIVAVLGLQVQNFSGGYFANTYQTYYFELIGQTNAFGLTAISSTLQFISNCVAVCLSDVLPRRKGLIGGGTLLCVWSIIIGGTSLASKSNYAANTALLAFMITWSMLYTATVGCYGWAVAQETASQVTRPKTIAFTLMCQQLTALLLSSVFPYFINPDELNWGGKVMFLFVAAELVILLVLFFVQPETKNRTYSEIETLYASKIPARKFSQYAVNGGVVREKKKKNSDI